MLSEAELVCFAATTNAEGAKRFYAEALGLELVEDTPFALVFNSNGTMLRIQKVQKHTPLANTTLGWHVRDIRAEMKLLANKGVRFERFGLPQDELGIWRAPSGALVAWFLDPDRNVLSLTQFQDG